MPLPESPIEIFVRDKAKYNASKDGCSYVALKDDDCISIKVVESNHFGVVTLHAKNGYIYVNKKQAKEIIKGLQYIFGL